MAALETPCAPNPVIGAATVGCWVGNGCNGCENCETGDTAPEAPIPDATPDWKLLPALDKPDVKLSGCGNAEAGDVAALAAGIDDAGFKADDKLLPWLLSPPKPDERPPPPEPAPLPIGDVIAGIGS